ncbi:MAG: SIS domain-containing protein [Bacteroidales bacterium]|nr:SIS domain-containing protein [Bacteroidales bacterium]
MMNCHTIREILQQPDVWMKTFDTVWDKQNEIMEFMTSNGVSKQLDIFLSGAGSSAYIADTAACLYYRDGYVHAKSVPTTDMVSCPEYFLDGTKKLVVSFGRSGDSPESVASYNIVRKCVKDAAHLIITCNADGYLALTAERGRDYVLVLPKETNDVSLAMTSSFTSMLAASILCKNADRLGTEKEKLAGAAAFAKRFFSEEVLAQIKKIVNKDVRRAVFLGSGPLTGIAREAHLKLQELTDGKIMCAYDSFLGLRHGPKAVIDDRTLVVYLLSDDEYTRKYEYDLIRQVNAEHNPASRILVSANPDGCDCPVDLRINGEGLALGEDNEYKFIPYVIIGQLLGYHFSLKNGLNPDFPSVSGAISRVVNGVKIYNY